MLTTDNEIEESELETQVWRFLSPNCKYYGGTIKGKTEKDVFLSGVRIVHLNVKVLVILNNSLWW